MLLRFLIIYLADFLILNSYLLPIYIHFQGLSNVLLTSNFLSIFPYHSNDLLFTIHIGLHFSRYF